MRRGSISKTQWNRCRRLRWLKRRSHRDRASRGRRRAGVGCRRTSEPLAETAGTWRDIAPLVVVLREQVAPCALKHIAGAGNAPYADGGTGTSPQGRLVVFHRHASVNRGFGMADVSHSAVRQVSLASHNCVGHVPFILGVAPAAVRANFSLASITTSAGGRITTCDALRSIDINNGSRRRSVGIDDGNSLVLASSFSCLVDLGAS
mmetsp:Transcript_63015/g.182719  ORF Transcript_63015/g.182719 Transcript_63015/m.182719 type:complete len:206 (-) Transcript_63015:422-1039(-)